MVKNARVLFGPKFGSLSKAFLYLSKIQCTAVSQCGDVYFLEMNTKGQIYNRYTEEIGQLDIDPKHKIHSVCISPTGCSLSVLFVKEMIFLKSCDLPNSVIKFYPLVREEDYETILLTTIRPGVNQNQIFLHDDLHII